MNFLLTSFIYPLEEPLVLSKQLGFTLDNPRTSQEIKEVKDYLFRSYQSRYHHNLEGNVNDISAIENILITFKNIFLEEDSYLAYKFSEYKQDTIFYFLASIRVIARFKDEGIYEANKEVEETIEGETRRFSVIDNNHSYYRKVEDLANYCSLLSLLIHTEKERYFGNVFLLETKTIVSSRQPTELVWRDYDLFGDVCSCYGYSTENLVLMSWRVFFPYIKENILSVSGLLERVFESELQEKEKLLYVGSILKIISYEVEDPRTKVVMLTSIIELLITHNPDFNRFNVEDSISKQFQLKASILIYLNDKTVDINTVKERLKTIYNQRSNIAHGNFSSVNKYKKELSKKEGKEKYSDELIVDLYKYIRAIFEEYLKDNKFVNFLKKN